MPWYILGWIEVEAGSGPDYLIVTFGIYIA